MPKTTRPPAILTPAIGGKDRGPKHVMMMQLFADGIERIDTILLEIRHLQSNLIYSMRFPALQRILRHEEGFLFGAFQERDETGHEPGEQTRSASRAWTEMFDRIPPRLNRAGVLADLADLFVPELARPNASAVWDIAARLQRKLQNSIPTTSWLNFDVRSLMSDVISPIARELRRRYLQGEWDDMFQSNYELFLALQLLKREAVLNKLHLADVANSAFSRRELWSATKAADRLKKDDPFAFEKFLFVRSICLVNASLIVERLADVHAQFEKTLDIGSQENHRPITSRRREQGIYNHVLSERAHESVEQTSRLLVDLFELSDAQSQEYFRDVPLIIHRWQHSYTSSNAETLSSTRWELIKQHRRRRREHEGLPDDATGTSDSSADIGCSPYFGAFSMNTQFYMPDRADIQPVMMHEASHLIILELLNNLSAPEDLTKFSGPMAQWLGEMLRIEDIISDPSVGGFVLRNPGMDDGALSYVREILADVISVSVAGPSYLFAMFEELFCIGIDQIANVDGLRFWRDLERARESAESGWGYVDFRVSWFTRLMICCEVLKYSLRPSEDTALTHMLIQGVRQNCEDMLIYLKSMEPGGKSQTIDQERRRFVHYRTALRNSGLTEILQAIRCKNQPEAKDIADPGNPQAPAQKGYAPFSLPVSRRLKESFVEKKICKSNRVLSRVLVGPSGSPLVDDVRESLNLFGYESPALFTMPGNASNLYEMVRTRPHVAAQALGMFQALHIGDTNDAFKAAKRAECQGLDDQFTALTPGLSEPEYEGQAKPIRREMRALLDQVADDIPIFENLGDIAWQASLIRTSELAVLTANLAAGKTSGTNGFCLIQQVSEDFAPGRETLQLAIELWAHDRRQRATDLSEAVRQARNIIGLPDMSLGAILNATNAAKMKPAVGGHLNSLLNDLIDDLDGLKGVDRADISRDPHLPQYLTDLEELSDNLKSWLGRDVDADFNDPDFAHLLAELRNSQVARAVAPLIGAGPTYDTALREHEDAWLRLLQDVGVSRLNDHLTVAMRLFELANMRKLWRDFSDQVKTGKDSRPDLADTHGALQILKLSSQYPWFNFDYEPQNVLPLCLESALHPKKKKQYERYAGEVGLTAAQKQARSLIFVTDTQISDVAHWQSLAKAPFSDDGKIVTPFRPILRFLRRTPVKADGTLAAADVVFDTATYSDPHGARVLQIAQAAHDYLTKRLQKITDDPANHAFDDLHDLLTKPQKTGLFAPTVPPHPRHPGYERWHTSLEALCQSKMEGLDAILKSSPIAVRFAPLKSLLGQAIGRGGDETTHEVLKSLSSPQNGLRVFRCFAMSRQSLINSAWWRETIGPVRTHWEKPDDIPSQDFFKGLKSAWAREREDHAAFYKELPHNEPRDRPDLAPPGIRRFATLGRYDYFKIGTDSGVFQIRQPMMDSTHPELNTESYHSPTQSFSAVKDEHWFETYFERKEKAVQLAISGWPLDLTLPVLTTADKYAENVRKGDLNGHSSRDVLCFMSVRLSRRANRLGFVRRVREAAQRWEQFNKLSGDALRLTAVDVDAWRKPPGENPGTLFENPVTAAQIAWRLRKALEVNLGDEAARFTPYFDPKVSAEEAQQKIQQVQLEYPALPTAPMGAQRKDLAHLFDCVRTYGDLPDLPLEAAGRFLANGDSVFLGEGWADLILVLTCDMPDRDAEYNLDGHRRVYDVFALQHILFQDPEVHRTEMFLRPVAVPLAAERGPDTGEVFKPSARFQITQAIRTREDRELGGMIQRMTNAIRERYANYGADPAHLPILGHIPGRNDLELTIADLSKLEIPNGGTSPDLLHKMTPSVALGALHGLAGADKSAAGGSSEELITRLGFRHFLRKWEP